MRTYPNAKQRKTIKRLTGDLRRQYGADLMRVETEPCIVWTEYGVRGEVEVDAIFRPKLGRDFMDVLTWRVTPKGWPVKLDRYGAEYLDPADLGAACPDCDGSGIAPGTRLPGDDIVFCLTCEGVGLV